MPSYCSRSHIGKVRSRNEDFFALAPEVEFLVVADGIGGRKGGEVASQLGVDSAMEYFREIVDSRSSFNHTKELANAIRYANEQIITIQRNEAKLKEMGTTLTCVAFEGDQIHYSWVGDTRLYVINPQLETIKQLTQDHTLDSSKIDAEKNPALAARAGSILTQSVGSILWLKPDSGSEKLKQGDVVLCCTDGLSDRVNDSLLLEYACKHRDDLEQLADKLLDRALDVGGQDNITFVLASV